MGASDDVLKDLHVRIAKTHEALRAELMKMRTGRANLAMLEGVKVDYYGTPTPLNGVASLSVADARLIVVKPWDKTQIPLIEKAVREANIGLNPQNDGEIVRIPVPALTEERRKEIVKQVKVKGEEHKVAIRNERRDAKEMLEEYQKAGEISEDDLKKALAKVQQETDDGVKKVDEVLAAKEKEVMQV